MKNDILEENPLKEKDLDVNEKLIKEKLSKEVSKFPSLPILNWYSQFRWWSRRDSNPRPNDWNISFLQT